MGETTSTLLLCCFLESNLTFVPLTVLSSEIYLEWIEGRINIFVHTNFQVEIYSTCDAIGLIMQNMNSYPSLVGLSVVAVISLLPDPGLSDLGT